MGAESSRQKQKHPQTNIARVVYTESESNIKNQTKKNREQTEDSIIKDPDQSNRDRLTNTEPDSCIKNPAQSNRDRLTKSDPESSINNPAQSNRDRHTNTEPDSCIKNPAQSNRDRLTNTEPESSIKNPAQTNRERLKHTEQDSIIKNPAHTFGDRLKHTEPDSGIKYQDQTSIYRLKQTEAVSCSNSQAKKAELNLILIGGTRQGNSSTGNSLLNRKAFRTSVWMQSEIKEIVSNVGQFRNYKLTVVDGFRLDDVGMRSVTAKQRLNPALEKCAGGVDAFLLVTRFGTPFTANDRLELDALKQILGHTFMDHVIVVVTGGDIYENALEEERRAVSFSSWCKEQGREFNQLYDDCKGRVVLMNNWERREEKKQGQTGKLLRLAYTIQTRQGRYIKTNDEQSDVILPNQKMPEQCTEGQDTTCLPDAAIGGLLLNANTAVEKMAPEMYDPLQWQDTRCKMQIQTQTYISKFRHTKEDHRIKSRAKNVKLNFILIGKNKQGNSATGNSLLNRRAFRTSAELHSEIKEISSKVGQTRNYKLTVVDGYRLGDEGRRVVDTEERLMLALGKCDLGVDAFLLVTMLSTPFTATDNLELDALKQILGDRFMDHVIVVVTGGDIFENVMEEQGRDICFASWFREQGREFSQLYDDCNGRVVLVNNWERRQKKKQGRHLELLRLAHAIQSRHGRYMKTDVEQCHTFLTTGKKAKICLYDASYGSLLTNVGTDLEKMNARAQGTIQMQDTNCGLMDDIPTPNDMHRDTLENNRKKEKVRLNTLLIGKTGNGKSATGNTILNRKMFETSSNVTSQTKEVTNGSVEFDQCVLMVVDGPGLEDTELDKVKDRETAINNISKALAMCYGGVDAFLLVMKFGQRFTAEDRSSVDALKNIFGDTFMSHVIVVMTYGDQFPAAVETDDKSNISFKEWCRQQEGSFCQLYKDCDARFVLFNNKDINHEKKQEQVLKLIDLINDMQLCHGSYTYDNFEKADYERKKFMSELNDPVLKRGFQETISLLTADIEALPINPSISDKIKLKERCQNIKGEIKPQDRGSGFIKVLKTEIKAMETNLDDTIQLKTRARTLEKIRTAKDIWSKLVTILSAALSCLAVQYPLVGGIASGASIVISGLGNVVLDGLEKFQVKKIKDLQQKKK